MIMLRNAVTPGFTRVCRLLVVLAMAGVVLGCGGAPSGPKRVPLSGVVTLNGQPLEGADITFFNDEDQVGMNTGSEGKFKIPIGAMPGEYKVTVSKREGIDEIPEGVALAISPTENPEMLPAHFSDPQQTTLSFTVPEDGTDSANFDLQN